MRIRSIAPLRAALAALALTAGAASLCAQTGPIIRGRVAEDSGGAPVPLVEMTLVGGEESGSRHVLTDSAGAYVIVAPRPGRYSLFARRIGYLPAMVKYELGDGADTIADVRLKRRVQALAPVTTVGVKDRENPLMEGFEHRRAVGLGIFLTRAQLEQRGSPGIGELVRYNPRPQFMGKGNARSAGMLRTGGVSSCYPVVFIDGVKVSESESTEREMRDIYQMFEGRSFEAAEIYRGISELPAAFSGPDVKCGAIVVWTRTPPPKNKKK
ncbi:MAG: carboxypeptidase-like regulatory domain-containing protein [Gemmatimonadaceae bacterium]